MAPKLVVSDLCHSQLYFPFSYMLHSLGSKNIISFSVRDSCSNISDTIIVDSEASKVDQLRRYPLRKRRLTVKAAALAREMSPVLYTVENLHDYHYNLRRILTSLLDTNLYLSLLWRHSSTSLTKWLLRFCFQLLMKLVSDLASSDALGV